MPDVPERELIELPEKAPHATPEWGVAVVFRVAPVQPEASTSNPGFGRRLPGNAPPAAPS
jgi:hypothetical protein